MVQETGESSILECMEKRATREGTERYKHRFGSQLSQDHYRSIQDLWVSSIGLGTYLGEPDEEKDRGYTESVKAALLGGANLIDTAINYRFQRSERNIGTALGQLMSEGKISRDEVVLSSKGGFLSFDNLYPPNPSRYFQEEYLNRDVCKTEDIVANCHCMTPRYLENQLDRSLQNLNVDCIDVYFIHNPETQLSEISRQEFLRRILAAFKMLEQKVSQGKIGIYGVATWDGFREAEQSTTYLSLEELIGLARNAGGENHHFRAVQLPYNLAMPEAFLSRNQKLGSASVSLIEAAHEQGMMVMASASILQGRLTRGVPDEILKLFGLKTQTQCSIQFVRSTPGISTALIGMSRPAHVAEDLEVARHSPLAWEKMKELFEE